MIHQSHAEEQELPDEVATLLLPMHSSWLMVPNVTVAEIVPFMAPQAAFEGMEDRPSWYLGEVTWRTRQVPLISFEGINDEPFVPSQGQRIAILNGVEGDPRLPFCGVMTSGVPRLLRVSPDELDQRTATLGPAESFAVSVGGEPFVIPNVDWIESQVLRLLFDAR